jgi:hypothetical protein
VDVINGRQLPNRTSKLCFFSASRDASGGFWNIANKKKWFPEVSSTNKRTRSVTIVLVTRTVPQFVRVSLSHVYRLLLALFASRYYASFRGSVSQCCQGAQVSSELFLFDFFCKFTLGAGHSLATPLARAPLTRPRGQALLGCQNSSLNRAVSDTDIQRRRGGTTARASSAAARGANLQTPGGRGGEGVLTRINHWEVPPWMMQPLHYLNRRESRNFHRW